MLQRSEIAGEERRKGIELLREREERGIATLLFRPSLAQSSLSSVQLSTYPNMSAIAVATVSGSTSKAPPPLWKPASVAPRDLPALPTVAELPISQAQCDKALTALLAHVQRTQDKREETDLLGEQEEKVFLVVGLKTPPKREVHKPVRMYVPLLADPLPSPSSADLFFPLPFSDFAALFPTPS